MSGTLRPGDTDPHDGHRRGIRRGGGRAQKRHSRWCPATASTPDEVGYLAASIKTVSEARVGDTITLAENPGGRAAGRLPAGTVRWFSAAFTRPTAPSTPICGRRWRNCSSTTPPCLFEPETLRSRSGFGFRCGFLGLLHMEIIQERLEREYQSRPDYHRAERDLQIPADRRPRRSTVDNPTNYPDPASIVSARGAGRRRAYLHARATMSARLWSCARSAGESTRTCITWSRPGGHSLHPPGE